MSKTTVMLPANWPGAFHRTVKDAEGNPVKDEAGNPRVLTFQPGQTVELTAEELESVRDDMGKALFIAAMHDAKPAAKLDRKATDEFVAKQAEAKAKAAKPAAKTVETPKGKDIEHKDKAK